MLPKIDSYGRYTNSNYGTHTIQVTIGCYTLYFSYKTLIAFDSPTTGLVCRENEWGPTTGKHMNWVQDKKQRVSSEEFTKLWATLPIA